MARPPLATAAAHPGALDRIFAPRALPSSATEAAQAFSSPPPSPTAVGCLVFRNWEAVATVPTAEPYDFFAREKLFLADPSAASGGGGFRSYSNGKAAGNLALDGLTVRGVHRFSFATAATAANSANGVNGAKVAEAAEGGGATTATTTTTLPPPPPSDEQLNNKPRTVLSGGALVLHYPWCGFDRWAKKAARDLSAHRTAGLPFYEQQGAAITRCSSSSSSSNSSSSNTEGGHDGDGAGALDLDLDALRHHYLTHVVVQVQQKQEQEGHQHQQHQHQHQQQVEVKAPA